MSSCSTLFIEFCRWSEARSTGSSNELTVGGAEHEARYLNSLSGLGWEERSREDRDLRRAPSPIDARFSAERERHAVEVGLGISGSAQIGESENFGTRPKR